MTDAGNWEGHTILNRLRSLDLRSPEEERRWPHMRAKLLARRAGRIRPGWDDKVLADWNGLMIAALAHAARVFERPDWLAAAATAFAFVARAHGEGRPPAPLLSRRPGQGAGHRQRLRQHDLGRAAALPGDQRARLPRRRRALVRHARRRYLGSRSRRLCLHRRRHARCDRAHARRPRRCHAQRQRDHDLQPGGAAICSRASRPTSTAPTPSRTPSPPTWPRTRSATAACSPAPSICSRRSSGGDRARPEPTASARSPRAMLDLSLPGRRAAGRRRGSAPLDRPASPARPPSAATHRLRLHRPAMLAAGDGSEALLEVLRRQRAVSAN